MWFIYCCFGFGFGKEESMRGRYGKSEKNDGSESFGSGPRELQLRRGARRMNFFNFGNLLPAPSSDEIGYGAVGIDEYDSEGLDRVDCDQDFQNKRVKVHSNSMECNYITIMPSADGASTSHADGAHSIYMGSSVQSENEIGLYLSSTSNNASDEAHMESIGGGDEDGDRPNSTSKVETFEVKMDLMDDLLHKVFSFLEQIDLCRAARVCRQWRAASSHEEFWKCLNFEDRNISVLQFADMCQRYPNAAKVNILGAPAIHLLAMKAINMLRNIGTLILGKGVLPDAFFLALGDCTALKKLEVFDATLGNGIQEISVYHEKLEDLKIIKCRVLRISVRCAQLEKLSLKRTNMAHAVLSCPQLLDLDIGSCHKLSDAGIRAAATSCPLLSSLDMSNCSCVSDETLREIALSCANLQFLNASYCPNISLESVRLPMLTRLRLDNCEGITSASMVAISHSYMLEVLELDNCGLLTSVSLDLPYLRDIRLVHCRKFVDLNLRCPRLLSIKVSNCLALHRINITSNSLQKLVLQKQESLSSLSLECQCLQEVDLTECESLKNSICKVFSDGGGCPTLRSLVLDSCESLTAVELRSTSLVSVSLVGCRAMIALELACPYLEEVHLNGCDHLERAFFCPVGLRSLNLGICPKLSIIQIDAPDLMVLELKGCGVLSEASIYCPRLLSLDASFCSQLQDDCLAATAASCPLVESLILMSCPSVGPDGLSSLKLLPNLTLLDLSYTFLMDLQPVYESCVQLKVLKLQACKYLTNSSLEALYKEGALPALRELDLSYGSLCQSAIEELLICCTHLTHLSLNGCANMHDLNWGSNSERVCDLSTINHSSGLSSFKDVQERTNYSDRLLQNLNCVGCPNIKKVVIPSIASCYQLLSLNLSLSANLKEVDVTCFNLSFLNLSNCCSLEILKLDCPRLTSLFLQGASRFLVLEADGQCGFVMSISEEAAEVAISHCHMLETLDVRYCPKICPVSMGRLRLVCTSLKRIFSSLSPP
ncbi:hypothetical protein GIB67_008059 [Kingdonia uniflora]|uniref:F-box domain-containing protein n=1 Tax=Kingdonia uniflora TaxID=39325 RepID=A0A7J7MMW6_9MAGN|nr:hypothetical protein GIB67_008059 [Kingdonia uniflora]